MLDVLPAAISLLKGHPLPAADVTLMAGKMEDEASSKMVIKIASWLDWWQCGGGGGGGGVNQLHQA